MKKTVFIYGAILAIGVLVVELIEHFYTIQIISTPVYIVAVAILFTVLGIWLGKKLTARSSQDSENTPFKRNEKARKSLGISDRELDVLEHLGKGHSNQEIANKLFISINTVKTHLSSVYQKLEVSRRSMAVKKARSLKLIP
ncbi:response regulator transcription factor [Gracilimonas sp. BCB1]|uniref:response regulator transcription factor n=1 Tax=Gracilimonas sp. BCB1 TaxID=3152362 RepID=UPI0032D99659